MQFSASATFAALLLATSTVACRLPHHVSSHQKVRPSRISSSIPVPTSSIVVPVPVPEPSTFSSEAPVPTTAAPPVPATTLITLTSSSTPAPAPTPEPTTEAPPAATTPPAAPGLSADEQAALDSHNAARAEVGAAALTWDASLAADAQTWATQLISVGGLEHSGASGQGENLYWQSNSETPCENGADAWVAEKSVYSGQPIGQGDFSAYGHYTQVIWSDTTKVGIAIATDAKGGKYVVARYTPQGNYIGSTPA